LDYLSIADSIGLTLIDVTELLVSQSYRIRLNNAK